MILNEMDAYRAALRKCRLSESAMPLRRGYVVENVNTWNKVQKLLDCQEFEECHKYLYNLDVDNLRECDQKKIDKLYNLAVERNFITEIEDLDKEDETPANEEGEVLNGNAYADQSTATAVNPAVSQSKLPAAQPVVKTSAFTCLYSATKDGEIKCGEYYSNALNTRSAKADCLAGLAKLGFNNVKIMAIEAGDPDACGCDDCECEQTNEEKCPDCGKDPCECDDQQANEDGDDDNADDGKQLNESSADSSDFCIAMMDKVNEGADGEGNEDDNGDEDNADESKTGDDGDEGGKKLKKGERWGDDPFAESNDPDDVEEVDEDDLSEDDMLKGKPHNNHKDVSEGKDGDEENDEGEAAEAMSAEEFFSDADKVNEDGEENAEGDSDDKDDAEIPADKKAELKADYTKTFRATMLKLGFEQCLDELSLSDRAKFWQKMAAAWTKEDPAKFLSDDEQKKFDTLVVKK